MDNLRPANDNGWYVLATIYGEQPFHEEDKALAARNRDAWNGVMESLLDENSRERLRKISPSRLPTRLSEVEMDEISKKLKAKIGKTLGDFIKSEECISLCDLIFDRRVLFEGFIFPRKFRITNCQFSGDSSFSDCVFLDSVDLGDLVFKKSMVFKGSVFATKSCICTIRADDIVDFSGCKFSGVSFNKSQFVDGEVLFRSSAFAGRANFEDVEFSGKTDFSESHFEDEASFHNSEFRAVVLFDAAWFHKEVPDFRGAKLHEATSWHGARWPDPPKTRIAALRQIDRYGRLKQEMAALKKGDLERYFFRYELRARRGTSEVWYHAISFRMLNFLYEKTSNYGDSFIYPLRYFVAIYIAGVFFYKNYFYFMKENIGYSESFKINTAIMFPFLPNKPIYFAPLVFDDQLFIVHIFFVIQSSSSYIFLFLMALALKNRFGLK